MTAAALMASAALATCSACLIVGVFYAFARSALPLSRSVVAIATKSMSTVAHFHGCIKLHREGDTHDASTSIQRQLSVFSLIAESNDIKFTFPTMIVIHFKTFPFCLSGALAMGNRFKSTFFTLRS